MLFGTIGEGSRGLFMSFRKLKRSERGASVIEYAMLLTILGSCLFAVPGMITNPARDVLLRAFNHRAIATGGGSTTSNQDGTGPGVGDDEDSSVDADTSAAFARK